MFPGFFSANGRTSPTQINCNEDEFLIFLPFSFSKVLQMSESLEPQDPFLQLKLSSLIALYQLSGVTAHSLKAKPEVGFVSSVKTYKPQQT